MEEFVKGWNIAFSAVLAWQLIKALGAVFFNGWESIDHHRR